jgi:hypothetical protein
MLRIRIRHNSPVTAVRWRGAPGEDAAPTHRLGIAEEAGPGVQQGRAVPEVQPPGFLGAAAESFARVAEGQLRAVR